MDFTIDKLVRALLIVLFSIIYIHEYVEVPEFILLVVLFGLVILFFSWKENADFQKSKKAFTYDFSIQKTKEKSHRDSIIGFAIFILALITPYFIEFPFEKRQDFEHEFYFYFVFFMFFWFTSFAQPSYDYYYFGKRFITEPGPEQKTILWCDIKSIETKEGLETFNINLKNGTKILFDLKHSYSDWKWDKLMNYFEEKEVNVVEWQKPRDSSLTQKYNNWWF